jgi:hypothetical protein
MDRVIGIALVAVLAALAGLGLSENSRASTPTPLGPLSAPTTVPDAAGPGPTATLSSPPAGSAATTTIPGSSASPGTNATVPAPVAGPVTAVGDSVLLDIVPELTADLPGVRIDGLVSRQFEAGVGVVRADRAAGALGRVLVVELGTNGAISPAEVDAMMAAAEGVTRVVFVNVNVPRDWAAIDNAVLAAGVARHPGVAVLADWDALSTPHPEWFSADRVHLDPTGAAALAALIARDA